MKRIPVIPLIGKEYYLKKRKLKRTADSDYNAIREVVIKRNKEEKNYD